MHAVDLCHSVFVCRIFVCLVEEQFPDKVHVAVGGGKMSRGVAIFVGVARSRNTRIRTGVIVLKIQNLPSYMSSY